MTKTIKKIKIEIDERLYDLLVEKLSVRGGDLGDYIEMHLRSLARQKIVLHLKDKMNFGKYYGEKVEDLVRMDPGYMAWALTSERGSTAFGSDVFRLMEDLHERETGNEDDNIPF